MSELHMKIEYLKNRISHIQTVVQWWFAEWGVPNNRSIERYDQWTRDHCNIDTLPFAIVLEVENEMVGVVCLRDHELEKFFPNLSPWIGGLFVDENKRKLGYGSFLVKEIEKECWNLGYKSAYLYTANKKELYRKLGWIEFEDVFDGRRNLVVMKKTLNPIADLKVDC